MIVISAITDDTNHSLFFASSEEEAVKIIQDIGDSGYRATRVTNSTETSVEHGWFSMSFGGKGRGNKAIMAMTTEMTMIIAAADHEWELNCVFNTLKDEDIITEDTEEGKDI